MARHFILRFTLAAVFLTGCGKEVEKEKEGEPVRPVVLGDAKRESFDRLIAADGILRALDQSAVTPKISAPVVKFFVNRGDHVTKGQLLAQLENKDLLAAVADAKGALDQAAAALRNTTSAAVPDELTKAESDTQAAKQSLDAAQKLYESRQQLFREGALARRLVDEAAVAQAQAKGQYDTARRHFDSVRNVSRVENVKGAQGGVDSAKGKLESAQAQLNYAEIRSPITGVVAERPLFAGELAAAGSPLLVIMDVSSVIARAGIPQSQAQYLRIGQPAKINSADGAIEASGRITVISPALDPQGTTVEVWVQAANPGLKLRPGSSVRVAISADRIRDAVVVPLAALVTSSEGGTAVLVVGSDMVAHEKKVKTGVRTNEIAEILEGIDAGVKIVLSGGLGLEDGTRVKLQSAKDEKKKDKDDEKKDDDKKDAPGK